MKPSASQRTVFAGFALVGVLLATVSVLGQVNAFSVFTDAIGVTSSAPGPGSGTEPGDDTNDTGAGSESDVVDGGEVGGEEPDVGGGSSGETTDEAILERLDALEEMVLALSETDAEASASLSELATVVKEVGTQLNAVEASLSTAEKTLAAHGGKLDSHDARIGEAEVTLGVVRTDLNAAIAALADITPRVARLDPTGTYLGDVKPAQIVPRLKVDDVTGDWPIGRTSGLLDGARLKVSNSSCWSAPRGFVNVLAPQVFEGVQCVRVAAP
jgi:hypothetical protein